jgi:hypothetical protein
LVGLHDSIISGGKNGFEFPQQAGVPISIKCLHNIEKDSRTILLPLKTGRDDVYYAMALPSDGKVSKLEGY